MSRSAEAKAARTTSQEVTYASRQDQARMTGVIVEGIGAE
jgi:hypothetical protein